MAPFLDPTRPLIAVAKAFSVLDLLTSSVFVDSNPTGYEPRYVNRWP